MAVVSTATAVVLCGRSGACVSLSQHCLWRVSCRRRHPTVRGPHWCRPRGDVPCGASRQAAARRCGMAGKARPERRSATPATWSIGPMYRPQNARPDLPAGLAAARRIAAPRALGTRRRARLRRVLDGMTDPRNIGHDKKTAYGRRRRRSVHRRSASDKAARRDCPRSERNAP